MKNRYTTPLRLAALLALAALPASPTPAFGGDATQADSDGPVVVGAVAVPSNVTAAQVKDAIVAAFMGREWTVREATGDHVTGHIKHRSHEAFMTANYTAAKVDLLCQSWKIDGSGAHIKFELQRKWIAYVKEDLERNLLDRANGK